MLNLNGSRMEGPGNANIDITSQHRRCFQENAIYRQKLDRTLEHIYKQMCDNIKRVERIQHDNYRKLDLQISNTSLALTRHSLKSKHSTGHLPSKYSSEWIPNQKLAISLTKQECEQARYKRLSHNETFHRRTRQRCPERNSHRSKPNTTASPGNSKESINCIWQCSGNTEHIASFYKSTATPNVKIENTLTCYPLSSTRRHVSAERWQRHRERHLAMCGITGCFSSSTRQYLSRDVFERLHQPKVTLPRQGKGPDGNCNKCTIMSYSNNFEELSKCRYLRFNHQNV